MVMVVSSLPIFEHTPVSRPARRYLFAALLLMLFLAAPACHSEVARPTARPLLPLFGNSRSTCTSHYMYCLPRDSFFCCARRSRRTTPNVAAVVFFLAVVGTSEKDSQDSNHRRRRYEDVHNSPRVAHHKEMRRKKTGRSDQRNMRRNIRPQISGGTRLDFPTECTPFFCSCLPHAQQSSSVTPRARSNKKKQWLKQPRKRARWVSRWRRSNQQRRHPSARLCSRTTSC